MYDDLIEVGRFGLGLRLLQRSDGKLEMHAQSANENIPIEMVITTLRAFLRNIEKEYAQKLHQIFFLGSNVHHLG